MSAQDAATDYVIPPSPEAATLGKYAQIPVGFYTGVPSIGISLWELTEGDISVPISLSYHASGHKVDEIAPRTGMGWVLNAGGVITRTIMGEADEYGAGGFLRFSRNNTPASVMSGTNEERFQRYENIIECADAEPDQFVFNFNGYSGKFAFNWDGQIVASAETKVKIEPVNLVPGADAFIGEWRITTADGMVYTFNIKETTSISTTFNFSYPCEYRNAGTLIPPVTSWYLSRIDSPNGHSVFFEYEPYSLKYKLRYAESISHRNGWSPATIQSRTETMTIKGQYLKVIRTMSGNTTIEIIPSTMARTDIPGTGTSTTTNMLFSLDEIRIHAKDQQNLRRFKMGFDYSIGRLCLKTVSETGSDGTSKPPYVFTYSGSLPSFTASYGGTFYSQDHWGFFNYANNSQLIPPYVAVSLSGQTYPYPGANRAPNSTGSRAGLLTQIKYPTGATTTFQFESHDYSFLNTTPIKKSEVLIGGSAAAEHSSEFSGESYASRRTTAGPFTIKPKPGNPYDSIPLIYNVSLGYCSSPGFAGGINGPRISILNANHLTVRSWHHTPNNDSYSDTLKLLPGIYYLEAYSGPTLQCTDNDPYYPKPLGWDNASGEVHWLEYTEPRRKNELAGGVRIKKIVDHDGIDATRDIVREFTYTLDENGLEVSSGVLQHTPKYSHDVFVYEQTGTVKYAQRVANSYIPLSMTQGSPVGYKQVAVFNSAGLGGKSVFYYKTFGDAADDRNDIIGNAPPFPPAVSREYKRGLLYKQIDYAYNNGSFSPVRQFEYDYTNNDSNPSNSIFALKVGENCVDCRFGGGAGTRGLAMDWRFFSLGEYAINLATSRLTGVKETLFVGNQSFVTEKKFAYDAALQFLLKESVKKSEGTEKITEYIYPFHFTNGPDAINLLKIKHILSPVIESITKEKSASGTEHVTGASFTRYGIFGSKALPAKLFQLAPDAPLADFKTSVSNTGSPDSIYNSRFYREVLTNDRYTANGHVEEMTTPGNIKTSYIWGHNRSVPIARINNAVVNRCAFTGFESADNGNWTYGDIETNYSTDSRTGRRSFRGNIWTTLAPDRYVLSLWAKGPGQIRVNNITQQVDASWKLYQWILDTGDVRVEPNGNLIDDARLHPATAQMRTFTYTPAHAISSITDENNKTVFYGYDSLGRLETVSDSEGNIVKHHQYHYKD